MKNEIRRCKLHLPILNLQKWQKCDIRYKKSQSRTGYAEYTCSGWHSRNYLDSRSINSVFEGQLNPEYMLLFDSHIFLQIFAALQVERLKHIHHHPIFHA